MQNTVTEVRTDSILIPVSAEKQRELICKLRCIDKNMPIRSNVLFSDDICQELQNAVQVLCNPQNREMRLSQVYRLAKTAEIPVIYCLTQENDMQNCYVIRTASLQMHLIDSDVIFNDANAEDVGHIPAMLLGYYRSIHPEAVEIGKLDTIKGLLNHERDT